MEKTVPLFLYRIIDEDDVGCYVLAHERLVDKKELLVEFIGKYEIPEYNLNRAHWALNDNTGEEELMSKLEGLVNFSESKSPFS